MAEKTMVIDMSKVEPVVLILKDNVVEIEYPLKRAYCTKEHIKEHIILPFDIRYVINITPEQEQCKDIFLRWETALSSPKSPVECLFLCGTYSYTDDIPLYSIDKGSAILLGLALDKEYEAISMKTGIVLIYAGNYRTAVVGMYKGEIYSTFGFCSALIEQEEVSYILEHFKRCCLSEEEIQDMGGCGSIFVSNIPEEADFSLVYCIGEKITKYKNIAVCIPYEKHKEYLMHSVYQVIGSMQ